MYTFSKPIWDLEKCSLLTRTEYIVARGQQPGIDSRGLLYFIHDPRPGDLDKTVIKRGRAVWLGEPGLVDVLRRGSTMVRFCVSSPSLRDIIKEKAAFHDGIVSDGVMAGIVRFIGRACGSTVLLIGGEEKKFFLERRRRSPEGRRPTHDLTVEKKDLIPHTVHMGTQPKPQGKDGKQKEKYIKLTRGGQRSERDHGYSGTANSSA